MYHRKGLAVEENFRLSTFINVLSVVSHKKEMECKISQLIDVSCSKFSLKHDTNSKSKIHNGKLAALLFPRAAKNQLGQLEVSSMLQNDRDGLN